MSRLDPRELKIRQRLKDDFPHYASRCLKIRLKDPDSGKELGLAPLVLNDVQRYIHKQIEAQRKRTGRVRALILKGRQQGCSTYVEGRFYWRVTHSRGVRAFILTHEDEATKNLFEMAERYHEHCPLDVKPHTGASSAKELHFDVLDSGYRVATAGTKGAGRSGTVQFFHGSEVAFWPNAESHMAGAAQQVPDLPGTEIILESTSAGAQGMFHAMWREAENGESDYQTVFVPWFWQREYRRQVPKAFSPTDEEKQYKQRYKLDWGQIVWRRAKIRELRGVHNFRREYPATVEEAFRAEVPGALWTRDLLDATRVGKAPEMMTRFYVAVDPAATSKDTSDETGIMAGGLGRDGHVYLTADESDRYTPPGWANRVVDLYDANDADGVVYEANQGGEMVLHTLRTVRKSLPCHKVWASRGKQARAEPIAAMMAEGRVHLVGYFPALEDELCTWVPGAESPSRMDAFVWLCWKMLIGHIQPRAPSSEGLTRASPWTV